MSRINLIEKEAFKPIDVPMFYIIKAENINIFKNGLVSHEGKTTLGRVYYNEYGQFIECRMNEKNRFIIEIVGVDKKWDEEIKPEMFILESQTDLFHVESVKPIQYKNYTALQIVFYYETKYDDFKNRLEKYLKRKADKLKDNDTSPDPNPDTEIEKLDDGTEIKNPYNYARKQYEQYRLKFKNKPIIIFRMIAYNSQVKQRRYIGIDDLLEESTIYELLEIDTKKKKRKCTISIKYNSDTIE